MNKKHFKWTGHRHAPIRIALPCKHHKSANTVRHQLTDLIQKIDADVQPIYKSSHMIKGQLKLEKTQTFNCKTTKRCLLLQVWSV